MATQKATSSASSSSILIGGTMTPFYASEVKDARNNFISHLHHALTQKGIKTFMDYHLCREGRRS
ncbi:hypothetical protein SAY87_018376 [Trapa incisa]|uniref:TIR domain-containing protein n=1 Tax=Trapa incisa TaxID=236973 RepID=A0AAN7QSR0_9MYRT|nr:hypothetical protein SAY87_018376 [Trapa incisa]